MKRNWVPAVECVKSNAKKWITEVEVDKILKFKPKRKKEEKKRKIS